MEREREREWRERGRERERDRERESAWWGDWWESDTSIKDKAVADLAEQLPETRGGCKHQAFMLTPVDTDVPL